MNKNIQTFLACDAAYEDADIVLFGAPFDGTTSFRPGTRFGPPAIRSESFGIETYSPYCDRDLTDCRIFDGGDLELPFGNPQRALEQIEAFSRQIHQDGKIPFMLGGEHLISLAAVRAALERYPDLHILHFDAHTDLREDYLGETLSHATVLRQIWNLVGDGRIHQFGIRSGERDEFRFAREHNAFHPFSLQAFEDYLPPTPWQKDLLYPGSRCSRSLRFQRYRDARTRRREFPRSSECRVETAYTRHRRLRCQRTGPPLRSERRVYSGRL